MDEAVITITISEYKKMVQLETRVDVLISHIAKDNYISVEDIYNILGRLNEYKERIDEYEFEEDC